MTASSSHCTRSWGSPGVMATCPALREKEQNSKFKAVSIEGVLFSYHREAKKPRGTISSGQTWALAMSEKDTL